MRRNAVLVAVLIALTIAGALVIAGRAGHPSRKTPENGSQNAREPAHLIADDLLVVRAEMSPGESGYLLTGRGLVWTTDGARTWGNFDVDEGTGVAAAAIEGDSLTVAEADLKRAEPQCDAHSFVYHSTDGGKSWTRTAIRLDSVVVPRTDK